MSRTEWTAEMDAALIRLRDRGATSKRAGIELGVSDKAAGYRARVLGRPFVACAPWSAAELAIIDALPTNLTGRQAAELAAKQLPLRSADALAKMYAVRRGGHYDEREHTKAALEAARACTLLLERLQHFHPEHDPRMAR